MQISELSIDKHPAWNEYVERHPDATAYHLLPWKPVAEQAYRYQCPFQIATDADGKIVGILPLFWVPGPFQGHLTTGLFGAYGKVLANTPEIEQALISKGAKLFEGSTHPYFIVKHTDPNANYEGFQKVEHWVYAVLDLKENPEALWNAIGKKYRNLVRKAESYQMEFVTGRELVSQFYKVLSLNMKRKGAPMYGFSFMQEIVERFGSKAEIAALRHEGRVISAAMLICHRDTVTVPFQSSLPDTFSMSPNNLLYWEIMKWAHGKGYKKLDFGQSLKESSTLQFKIHAGSQVFEQPCFVKLRDGKKATLERDNPMVDNFTKVWAKVPSLITDRVGPFISRRWLA